MVDFIGLTQASCLILLVCSVVFTMKNTRVRQNHGRILCVMLLMVCLGFLIISLGYHGLFREPFSLRRTSSTSTSQQAGDSSHIYGIMFDAGSTGSRIHVFKFKDVGDDKPFEFVEELFEKVTPGLSSYADDPKQAAGSLKDMMEKAKTYIPEDQWESTLIALKATAGLRKLQASQADAILEEVKQLFVEYPFKHTKDSVAIMEGTDEGVFSWFTVNFYMGVIGNSEKMVGVMDLGGGSTQITFNPIVEETISSAPETFISDTKILGKDIKLYTHSYLDLGLMAGRLQAMGGKVGTETNSGAPLPVLKSPCFPESFTDKFEFGQDEYTVQGLQSSTAYGDCSEATKKVIQGYNIHTSAEIQKKMFTAISYFFDRAVDANLVGDQGGLIKVKEYGEAAEKACSNPSSEKPYLCLDLCYLSSLLEEGYKMDNDNTLSIQKHIKGEEISWALGAMFDFIGTHQDTQR